MSTSIWYSKEKTNHGPVLEHAKMDKPSLSLRTRHERLHWILFVTNRLERRRARNIIWWSRTITNRKKLVHPRTRMYSCFRNYPSLPYVAYNRFKIYSDHFALSFKLRKTKLSGRLARYAMKIVHRKGKHNVVADALSRRTYPEPPEVLTSSLQWNDTRETHIYIIGRIFLWQRTHHRKVR